MKILLTGATGFIGRHILHSLERSGHEVIGASRRSGCDFSHMSDMESWLPLLDGVDAVINAVGIIVESPSQRFDAIHHLAPAALFRASAQIGIKRVIQISALGVDDASQTPYQRSKQAADDVLRSLALDWFVLRPSLVYGEGGKSVELFRRLARMPVLPLMDGGRQQIQPVHVDDVAAAVLHSLTATPARRTLNLVGPRPLNMGDWLQIMRRQMGKKPMYIIDIPAGAVLALASLAHRILPILHPDNLRMLAQGNTADVRPFAEFIGRMPAGVEYEP